MTRVQLTSPVLELRSTSTEHPTAGLAGYPAHDWFADAGTAVLSPVAGTVRRLSGHDPRQGAIAGAHGPLGWSIYVAGADGRDHYLTHLGSRVVKLGDVVKRGTVLGTVASWGNVGTPSHVHYGVTAT